MFYAMKQEICEQNRKRKMKVIKNRQGCYIDLLIDLHGLNTYHISAFLKIFCISCPVS